MKIIVLDIEMNQPSNNIIQIGAVCVDLKTGVVLSSFDEIANPGELPNAFITELTGIAPDMVGAADSLANVLVRFWAWCESCQCGMQMGAWGSDVWEIIQATKALGGHYKTPKVLNIKEMAKVFRSALPGNKVKKTGGLKNTCDLFGVKFKGPAHNAYWDALATADLLIKFANCVSREIKISQLYNT